MAEHLRAVLIHLRKLMGRAAEGSQDDRALLEQFVRQHEEAAFAELVRRHGPMVLGVCRRILRNAEDADDAFQVTFLTLACKAHSLRDGQALAHWLYRVAVHTAWRAKAHAARRREQERQAEVPLRPDPAAEVDWGELGPILHEELNRLPEKCRAPLVLCCLEGKTHEEAARTLGWPTGSLSKRLARGRELLRQRLSRRGFSLPAAALATLLTEQTSAALPGPLTQMTIRTALLIASGQAVAGVVSAPVALLLKQTLQDMLLRKLLLASVVLLALGVLGAASGFALRQAAIIGQPKEKVSQTAEGPPAPIKPAPDGKQRARSDRYGDPLPEFALARLGTLRLRHGQIASALALSGDGKTVVSLGWDGPIGSTDPTIRVWDTITGQELRQFSFRGLAGDPLGQLALSPDGKTLALAQGGPPVSRMVRVPIKPSPPKPGDPKQRIRFTVGAEQGDKGDAFGKPAASRIRLWDMATGQELRQLALSEDRGVVSPRFVFAADSKMLASWQGDSTIHLWDVATGQKRSQLSLAANEKVNGVAWSLDGRSLAAAGADGTICLWQLSAARQVHHFRGDRAGTVSLAFSPDGKVLASGGPTRVHLWDTATGDELRSLPDPGAAVFTLAFSADGQTIVALSRDKQGGAWCVAWDRTTGKELRRFAVQRQVFRNINPGLMLLFAGSSRQQPLALSAGGMTLAQLSGTNSIVLWDVASGKYLQPWGDCALACHDSFAPDTGWVGQFAFSPDGKHLASWCIDGRIRLWRATTGEELRPFEECGNLLARLVFSADGKTLISLGAVPASRTQLTNGTVPLLATGAAIHLWDTSTGKKRRDFPVTQAGAYALSPDGKTLATAADVGTYQGPFVQPSGTVLLWDLATGKEVRRFEGTPGRPAISLAFTPDGKTLAAAGVGTPLHLWDVATGEERSRLSEPEWEEPSNKNFNRCHVSFSEGGRTLVSVRCPIPLHPSQHRPGQAAVQICAWDITTGRKRRPLKELPNNWDFRAFSPDGKVVAFADPSHTIHIWDVAAGQERCQFKGHQAAVMHVAFSPDGKTLASGSRDTTILIWDLNGPNRSKERLSTSTRPLGASEH